MAEPARRLDDEQTGQVYDNKGTEPSDPKPDLKALEGGSETSAPKHGQLREAGSEDKPSQEDLTSAEESAGDSDSALQHENQVGRGYRPGSPQPSRSYMRGRLTKKRALFGGGILATIVSIIAFFIISGPAQLVQLSQLLQHNFSKSQSDSESRTTHLLRDFKSIREGDYRYTRVGLIGAKVMSKVVGQFEDSGVKFTGSDVLGRPTGIQVDQTKVAETNPEVKGMNSQEFDQWLNETFNVDPSISFKDGKLDISGLKAQSIRTFINKASTEILGNSKAVAAAKTRTLKKFFGLDSLFHPLTTAIQDRISAKAAEIQKQNPNESQGSSEEQAATSVEDEIYESNVSTIEEPGVEGFDSAKAQEDSFSNKISSKLLPGLGLLWATGCTLKGVSGAIVSMNRYLTVLPTAVEATNLIAVGSQVQNGGNDVSLEQLGATERSFTNSAGQTIWAGAALQAMEGSTQANALPRYTSGSKQGQIVNDLPNEYKQAYGTDTTASTINKAGDLLISWFPLSWISGVVPGGACGLIGGFTIIVAGAIAQIGLAVVNAPDGETGDVAVQTAIAQGEQGIVGTLQGILLGPLINKVVDQIAKATAAPKIVRGAFSGALGGNLIAYGARAASNSAGILNGGLALANNASTIIGSAGVEEQQQFKSESVFVKLFDINDYRSLAGHFATLISPNPIADMQLGVNNVLNVGGSFASLFNHLIPHATAASNTNSWTGNYDWGFPQYGIPNNMLSDPALSDPYQNSEAVGKYLSSVCKDGGGNIGPSNGACGGGSGYTQRIMDCFGNQLTYANDSGVGGEVWDLSHAATATSPSTDVNPVSDSYISANCSGICSGTLADCNNPGEKQWEKIVMFVNDANNIKTLDCLAGYTDTSDQSCSDIGLQASATSKGGGQGSGSGSPVPGQCGGKQQYAALVGPNANFAGVDQGIDFTPKSSAGYTICAPGSGTIVQADQTGHQYDRTNGQALVVEKLDSDPGGSSSSKYIYYAEIITIASGINVGAHINKGDAIGTNNLSPGIEVGWASGSGGPHSGLEPLCALGGETPCGQSFDKWILSGGGS